MIRRVSFPGRDAFTLVEVVIALAVISFSLLLIIGTIGIGLRNNLESSRRLDAANIASLLISERAALPGMGAGTTNFGLPSISSSSTFPITGTTQIASDGSTTNSPKAFNLSYTISTNSTPNLVNVDMILWWPVAAPHLPTNNPGNYYEVVTQVGLTSQVVSP